MKILITSIGTRGDVQPYVALGRALLRDGHAVTICTCVHFESFVRQNGLGYAYVNDELIDFMHTADGKAAMGNSGSLWKILLTAVRLIPKLGALQDRQMADVWEAAKTVKPDLIIYHPKAVGAPDFAEKLGIPSLLAFYLPMFVPTGKFPAMGFPDLPLGPWYHRLTYQVIRQVIRATGKRMRKWRLENRLAPKSPGVNMQLPDGRQLPVMHGFSRHMIPRPDDWPESAIVTGFWFLDQVEDWSPPSSLVEFLSKGEPPVYFGFGSIFGQNPARLTEIVLEAVQRTGVRAILAPGWGGLDPSNLTLPETVMTIGEVRHDWLFPRVAAVVHHGGCGTTSAGLLAGRPSIICPFFGDQPFWGRQVARLRVGPSPIPQSRLTVDRLCRAIDEVMNDTTIRENAAALGGRLHQENGVANAVAFVNRWTKYAEN
jgi:sterol 3beta-glucosyltransferase